MTIEDGLLRYFAIRQQERRDRVLATLAAMTPRERRLVREAAVMGYVQGVMAGRAGVADIPADSAVMHTVIDACLSNPDLYPVIGSPEESS